MTMEYTNWNPSDKSVSITLSNGDLTAVVIDLGYWVSVRSILSKSAGKWYWECAVDSMANGVCIGIDNGNTPLDSAMIGYSDENGYSYYSAGMLFHDGYLTGFSSYSAGDVIGIALDLDNGKIWWSKNGVWEASGNPGAGTGEQYSGIAAGAWFASLSMRGVQITANFGASAFSYSVPSGFNAGFYESPPSLNMVDLITDISTLRSKWWLNTDIQIKTPYVFFSLISSMQARDKSLVFAFSAKFNTIKFNTPYPVDLAVWSKFLLLRYDHVPARNEQNVPMGKVMVFRLYSPDPLFSIDLSTFKVRFDEGVWFRYGNPRLTFTKVTYKEYLVYFNPPPFAYDRQVAVELYCEDHMNNPGIKLEIL